MQPELSKKRAEPAQSEPPSKVVVSDIDISFERAIQIVFVWTLAALIVNSAFVVVAIIVVVLLLRGQ